MIDQSVQPPNFRDNYTLILTPDELSLLKTALIEHLAHGGRDQDILDALYSKLQLTLSSDGACLRPAQSLEAVGQGGTNVTEGSIYDFSAFPDPVQVFTKYSHYSDDELQNEIEFLSYENGRVARGHASQVSESLKEALEEKALRPLLKREYDDTEGRTCFVCSCDPCVCLPEAVEQGGSIRDSVRHGGTVVPDHICGQCYTDKSDSHSCNRDDCLEKSISSDGACLHSAQSSDPVPLQRSRVDFSLRPYSCGLCGMYHRKEQSCMPDMKPRDSEKGLLGFHEFYGPSYHAEDFDIDGFVFDYLTSPDVGNGVRS
ncbi:MAG: hypothetical protein QX197_09395 [Methylococcaceae bacterium]